MNFFTKLFKKKAVVEIPPMPSWETVVEMMYDKHLDAFSIREAISSNATFNSHFKSSGNTLYYYVFRTSAPAY
jgi:hypothetical protein